MFLRGLKYKQCFENFGRGIVVGIGRFIGLNGIDFVRLRRLVVSGSRKLRNLMIHYWPNKFGR